MNAIVYIRTGGYPAKKLVLQVNEWYELPVQALDLFSAVSCGKFNQRPFDSFQSLRVNSHYGLSALRSISHVFIEARVQAYGVNLFDIYPTAPQALIRRYNLCRQQPP